jgi:hypothetical protein
VHAHESWKCRDFQGIVRNAARYALEVSHRVRGIVLGVPYSTTENVALVLSEDAAKQLVAAKNLREEQAMPGKVYLYRNAEQTTLQLADQSP